MNPGKLPSTKSGLSLRVAASLAASILLWVCPPVTVAHQAGNSYLTLTRAGAQLRGEWHLALRDLHDVLDLDADGSGDITWGELRSQQAAISNYALARLQLGEAPRPASLHLAELLVDIHSDGAYAVLRFTADHSAAEDLLHVEYSAFFEVDRLHRGWLRLETPEGVRTAVFGPDAAVQRFAWSGKQPGHGPAAFIREGVWHIWTGYDHILFLLALLLPGSLRLSAREWEPVVSFRVVLGEVVRIVTAFAVAHSLTLSLAVLGWVHPPARLVECTIAASVILAAANNIRPICRGRAWLVAFVFGLVHGFGFANALADLGLRPGQVAGALLAFNLGVEAGQLAIVLALLPALFVWRDRVFYRNLLLPVGSCAIALVASFWLAERLFD